MAIKCSELPTPLHKAKLLNFYTRIAIVGWVISIVMFAIAVIILGIFYQTTYWWIYLPIIGFAGHFFILFNLILVILASCNILKTDWEDEHLNKIKKTYGTLGFLLLNPIACYLFLKCAIDRIKESDEQYKSIHLSSYGML